MMTSKWWKRAQGFSAVSVLLAGCIGEEPTIPTFPECSEDETLCGATCVNLAIDSGHCGDCDTFCNVTLGEVCFAGSCTCGEDHLTCEDGCVDPRVDPLHCGDCETACDTRAGEVCSNGTCTLACGGGTKRCGDRCVSTASDPDHCGDCETVCALDEVCSEGECAFECAGGATLCDRSCVDTANDPTHCGNCETSCVGSETCSGGACSFSCGPGTTRCDDRCVDLEADAEHCGDCDTRCGELASCIDGDCRCPYGYEMSGGSCRDIDECAGANACSPSGECINVEGSYACSCRDNQSGDGETCTGLVLVTRGFSGTASPNPGDVGGLAIGADGRYVAFTSTALALVEAEAPYSQAYLRDVVGGTTQRASVNAAGEAGNSSTSGNVAVSTDGNLVAFLTGSWNLGSGDADYDLTDLYLRDFATMTTSVVSETPETALALGNLGDPVISDDGRYLAFWAQIPLTENALADRAGIYRVEIGTDDFELVDLNADGDEPELSPGCDAGMNSFVPALSADGSRIAFQNEGFGLTGEPDDNCVFDVYVRDVSDPDEPTTTLASVNPDGEACTSGAGQRSSGFPSLSADGTLVAFESGCIDLVGTDTQDFRDVFVRDLVRGTTRKVSVDRAGGESNSHSYAPTLSADGRYVAFVSDASDIVSGDSNDAPDVFVRDLQENVTIRVSLDADGEQFLDGSSRYAFARNGGAIAFVTKLALLPEDTNAGTDIYLRYIR